MLEKGPLVLYIPQWAVLSMMVQEVAWRLLATKPFPEPVTDGLLYRKVSNIRPTKSQNLNASRLIL